MRQRSVRDTCALAFLALLQSFLLCSTSLHAELAPRTVYGTAGLLSISAFSEKYKPSRRSLFASGAGLDVGITPRSSLALSTLMTASEGLVGWTIGWRMAFVPRRIVDSGGQGGVLLYTTVNVPRWHFDVMGGLSRYRFSQSMISSDTTLIRVARQVPVKADLIGLTLTPTLSWAWDEHWKIDGMYSFQYGAAGGFTVIAHGILSGLSWSF
jgi:hypothetical protein